MLEIQPTKDVPVPFDLSDEQPKTHADSIAVAVNTVEMIESLGGSIDFDAKDFAKAVELSKGEAKTTTTKTVSKPGVAKTLAVAAKKYDFQVFADVQQARNFVTNRLIQIAECGDVKVELKALELLGKHSDIGLFTERSEITVHHTSSKSLEESIKERVKRLMNADVVDVKSSLMDELDEVKESRRPAEKKFVDTIEDVEAKPEENNNP
jgi:neutral trehalase